MTRFLLLSDREHGRGLTWEDEVLQDFCACCSCVDEAQTRGFESLLAVGRPQTELAVVLDLLGRWRHRALLGAHENVDDHQLELICACTISRKIQGRMHMRRSKIHYYSILSRISIASTDPQLPIPSL